jgi:Cu/Ag efflux pump CusA
MLNKIILSALKNRLLVICVALIIAFAGFWQAGQMPVDIFPDLNRPQVVILTEAPGMTTEDVENLISRPIEQMLNGATGVENVRSQSGLGLSAITVQFGWGTDIYRNRQIVQENLQSIKELLPANVHLQMMPISSIMGQIQMISFSSRSGKTSIEKLRDLVDNDIRYRLLGIPGVAKVISIGGSPRQLQIYCNPDKMRQLNISIQEVEKAIQNRNLTSSGGYLNIGNQAPVITVDGLIKSGNDLNDTVVAIHDDRSVTLSEIATISFGSASNKIGEAGVNGKPAVLITVMKQPETDTVQLSNAIEKSLQELSKSYNDDIEINTAIFKQADFITRAIDNVIEAVRDGSIMVVIILVLFLMNLRISFITLTAIPLSIAVTALIFALFDVGINTMTLGGIAVAVGALVDDAIVDVENVYRRLRQNQLLNSKTHPYRDLTSYRCLSSLIFLKRNGRTTLCTNRNCLHHLHYCIFTSRFKRHSSPLLLSSSCVYC